MNSLQDNKEDVQLFPMMTPEEAQALQAHLEAAAAILFKNTPAEQLQDFESIERSVRDQVLEQVSPQIGNFFT
ncbi:MAG: hypothetical protein KME05_18940 [Gloeocapsa sp. UFS-A4-WI-NPMV-4B04]|nr:hypothetical protein [Gloeocapsa sp. UFS-A4-WI-NPMV-4B04]